MPVDTKGWLKKLTSDFGKISANIPPASSDVIQLSSPSFNWSTGTNGIPVGRSVCFFGGENSGKSLLMQLLFASIQKKDPDAICILFDTEYSHNSEWFAKLGGDPTRLIVRQTNDPVKIFDFMINEMNQMVQDGAPIRAVGIDSVKNIAYPKDIKEVTTNMTMGGGGASYLGPTLKRLTPVLRENNITIILVQQVNEEMDPMKARRNPYKVPDGRALKHFCDLMIQVDKVDSTKSIIEGGDNIAGSKTQIGHKIRLKNKKSRVGIPYRVAEFTLRYDTGIVDTTNELIDLAISLGVAAHPINPETGKPNVQMWQFGKYPGVRGEENFRKTIAADPKLAAELLTACGGVTDIAALQARNDDMALAEVEDLTIDEL